MRDWCSECQFANYGGSQEPCYNCVTAYNKKPSEFTPAADEARGVVHCRECELWNEWDSAGKESLGNFVCSCAHWTVEDGAVLYTTPSDFCSYGERKVSEDA